MDKVIPHIHNGVDAEKISFDDLVIQMEAAIADPSGGATIDSAARTAIIAILTVLRNKGLIES